ncbi:symmetrical bis(5'-nucleosyl)-tetraphosphatase [Phytohalomonas tamaricis]|uniref:symmetrical bis(5'-nucleosyl)-tetraphosphatase n=1 Tax=Phytohalomonas tamaricis TaxID=2081032 RepID=UPI000D0B1C03|nr:symmetrical bis(5'-nucleosyl)-tetraphosphatase [Phytohalomonas tamaricis]
MSMYAIGDLHGCHVEFEALLEKIGFEPARDMLWLTGDLVNRGPDSLTCLRRVKALGESVRVVLGNHDLHLLAVAYGAGKLKKSDTLDAILEAPDRIELLDWLRCQPLMVATSDSTTVMTHAGLLPQWSVKKTAILAREAESVLSSDQAGDFIHHMYGNSPARFVDDLEGWDRIRAIVNVFTRMRFIAADGTLDFDAKEGIETAPGGFAPWFQFAREHDDPRIIFGHWASLEGRTPKARVNVEALDTGCMWGGALTALDLTSGERVAIPSQSAR